MVKFTELVNSSLEWTATILFRPFKLKKWLILTFTATLAAALVSGCNIPFRSLDIFEKIKKPPITKNALAAVYTAKQTKAKYCPLGPQLTFAKIFPKSDNIIWFIGSIILAIMLIFFIWLILIWLSCRFCFVFLDNVAKNDASIKIPFKEHKALGNSLFQFELLVLLISIISGLILAYLFIISNAFGMIKGCLSTQSFGRIFLICLPFAAAFLLLMIFAGLIYLITRDFAASIMYKDKIGIMQALGKVFNLFKAQKLDFLKYILLKIGLGICAGIIYNLVTLFSMFGLFIPLFLLACLSAVLYAIVPAALQILYFVILALIFIPALACLIYFMFCLNLPFAVFFRTLSLKFLGRIEQHYDLFTFEINKETI